MEKNLRCQVPAQPRVHFWAKEPQAVPSTWFAMFWIMWPCDPGHCWLNQRSAMLASPHCSPASPHLPSPCSPDSWHIWTKMMLPNRNITGAIYVILNYLVTMFLKWNKRQVTLIVIIYFILPNISKILSFKQISNIQNINKVLYILLYCLQNQVCIIHLTRDLTSHLPCFQAFSGHMWLVAPMLDSEALRGSNFMVRINVCLLRFCFLSSNQLVP